MWLSQTTERSPSLQEHLLGQVISNSGVTTKTSHQVANPGLPATHQFRERIAVTGTRQANDQRLVAIGVDIGSRLRQS